MREDGCHIERVWIMYISYQQNQTIFSLIFLLDSAAPVSKSLPVDSSSFCLYKYILKCSNIAAVKVPITFICLCFQREKSFCHSDLIAP